MRSAFVSHSTSDDHYVAEMQLLRLSRDVGVHLLEDLQDRTLLGDFLKRAFHGGIRQRDRVKIEKADAEEPEELC
jgi:hypothetical protein